MQILALPLIYRDPVWFLRASVYLSMKEGWAPHPDPTCAPAQLDTANAQDLAFPLLLAHLHSLHPSSLRALLCQDGHQLVVQLDEAAWAPKELPEASGARGSQAEPPRPASGPDTSMSHHRVAFQG